MPVVMLVAAGAVLIGVVVVALGRGGELAFFPADYFPLKLEQVTATDVALFRPPVALWGYNAQATDEALNRIATALTERDIEISALQQQVADLEARGHVTAEAVRRREARPPAEPEYVPASDETAVDRPSAFGDSAPSRTTGPARAVAGRPPFEPPPLRRPDPPFSRPTRPDARSRFGLPADEEDEDG